jgi:hypothetical protein
MMFYNKDQRCTLCHHKSTKQTEQACSKRTIIASHRNDGQLPDCCLACASDTMPDLTSHSLTVWSLQLEIKCLCSSSSSRKVSGLTPTAVFALATPKSPIDRGGRWQLQLYLYCILFFTFIVQIVPLAKQHWDRLHASVTRARTHGLVARNGGKESIDNCNC